MEVVIVTFVLKIISGMLCEGHLWRRCVEMEMEFCEEARATIWAVEVKDVGLIRGRVSRNKEKACWDTAYESRTQLRNQG